MAEESNNTYGSSFNSMIQSMNNLALTATSKKGIKKQMEANKEFAKLNNDYAIANYKMQRDDAYKRENELNLNKYKTDQLARQKAGMSPQWTDGDAGTSFASVGVGGMSQGTAQAPDMASIEAMHANKGAVNFQQWLSMKMQEEQIENLHVVNRKTKAEAESIELDNLGTHDSNRISSYFPNTDVKEENGKLLVKFGENDWIPADQYPKTKKGMECLNDLRKIQSENYQYHSRQTKAELEDMVSRLQINDKYILKALMSMPEAQYEQIRSNTSKTDIETEILENEKYLFKNLEDGSIHSLEDARKVLVSILYTFFGKK